MRHLLIASIEVYLPTGQLTQSFGEKRCSCFSYYSFPLAILMGPCLDVCSQTQLSVYIPTIPPCNHTTTSQLFGKLSTRIECLQVQESCVGPELGTYLLSTKRRTHGVYLWPSAMSALFPYAFWDRWETWQIKALIRKQITSG